MRNKFGDGNNIDLLNASGVDIPSGGVVVEGNIVAIATQNHPNGATLPCERVGEFDVLVTDAVGGGIGRGAVLTCTLATGAISNTPVGAGVVFYGYALGIVGAGGAAIIRTLKAQ